MLRETIAYIDGSPYAGILLAAVVGIGRAYPEMRLDDVLNDAGKQMREAVDDQCIEDFALAYPGARLDDLRRFRTQRISRMSRERFAAAGIVTPRDFHLASVALVGAINGPVNTWTADPDFDAHIDAIVEVAADLIVAAVSADAAHGGGGT